MAEGHGHTVGYAPTNEASEEEKEDFYKELQAVLEQVPGRDVKIVMGDINAKVGTDNTAGQRGGDG